MSIAALLLLLQPTAADFAAQAEGLWTSASQSQSGAYDFVASESRRFTTDDGQVWLYQQNWILGPRAGGDAETEMRRRHDVRPYFQVAIRLADFGDGVVHTTTYRIGAEARESARGFLRDDAQRFDRGWLGEAACMGEQRAVADGYWNGSASCPNTYRGGVKVESTSIRTPGSYVNWDRGYDLDGNHIWGPAEGGYIFLPWGEN